MHYIPHLPEVCKLYHDRSCKPSANISFINFCLQFVEQSDFDLLSKQTYGYRHVSRPADLSGVPCHTVTLPADNGRNWAHVTAGFPGLDSNTAIDYISCPPTETHKPAKNSLAFHRYILLKSSKVNLLNVNAVFELISCVMFFQ